MIAAHFTRIVTGSPQSWTPGLLWYKCIYNNTFGGHSYVENLRIGNAEVTQGRYCL